METQEEEISSLFSIAIERLTYFVTDFSYQGKKIGRGIFILNYIGYNNQCTMKDIVENLNFPPSTATRQVDHLVKGNFIKRTVPDHNRRIVELTLTDLGKKVYLYHKEQQTLGMTALLQDFSKEEKEVIIKVLRNITENIEKFLRVYINQKET